MSTSPEVAGLRLDELWKQVRNRLDPADDAALGEVHVGVSDAADKPWADTNHGEDRVNLTLELKPEQLELNLTGWKVMQSEALRNWLQSIPGELAVNSLTDYTIVAFKRRAYKRTPTSRPWWQDETIEELDSCAATSFNPGWISQKVFRIKDHKAEKLAFHVRRAWPREDAEALGGALPEIVAIEVRRLLPILRDIWSLPDSGGMFS